MTRPHLPNIQAAMRARIREFDIPALLHLLAHMGYRRPDIAYRGHFALGPQPTLLHAIDFPEQDGPPGVVITLNLGLLSCRTPLPSYFLKLITDVDTSDPLTELLQFIDHTLIESRCTSYRPEQQLTEWPQVVRDLVRMSGLGTPGTLCALFGHIFPELDVSAYRRTGRYIMPAPAVRVGYGVLGRCAFGSQSAVPVSDIEVVLRCDQAESRAGVPWIREAQRRLHDHIFPLLSDIRLHLTVVLIQLYQDTFARLSPDSYVGYDPLWGGVPKPRRVVLFQGPVTPASAA